MKLAISANDGGRETSAEPERHGISAPDAPPPSAGHTYTVATADLGAPPASGCDEPSEPPATASPITFPIGVVADDVPGKPLALHEVLAEHGGGATMRMRVDDIIGDRAYVSQQGGPLYRVRLRTTGKRHRAGRFEEPGMRGWFLPDAQVELLRVEATRRELVRREAIKRGRYRP